MRIAGTVCKATDKYAKTKSYEDTSRREPAPELLSPVLRALLKRDDRQGNQSRSRNFRGIPKTAEQQYEMDEIRPLPGQIVRRGIEHDRNGQQRY